MLHQVLETARDLTGARYAALGIPDERKRELERFVFVGIDEETRREIGPLPRGRGVLGELIRRPQPLRLSNEMTPRARSSWAQSIGTPPPLAIGHRPRTAAGNY